MAENKGTPDRREEMARVVRDDGIMPYPVLMVGGVVVKSYMNGYEEEGYDQADKINAAVSRLISEAEKKAEEAREKLIMDTLRNYLKKDFWCEERDPINHPIGRVIGLLKAVKENQDGACLDVLEKAAKIVDGLCPKSGPLHTEDYGCLLCAQAAYHSAEIRALIRGKGEEGSV